MQITPENAWQTLPKSEWHADAARHLLHRACWTARPEEVQRAIHEGMEATLERIFPEKPVSFPRTRMIEEYMQKIPDMQREAKALKDPEAKREAQKRIREEGGNAFMDLCVRWLGFASKQPVSAIEKWTLFLGDIYVISEEKVRNPVLIHLHQEIIRQLCMSQAPTLTKAISRSPAMIWYLDLQESKAGAPNENFARELFELFTLGEGNYTENDIKEAAKAFTGYRSVNNRLEFRYMPKMHDNSQKMVFGETENFDGDGIIDLVYRQKAASYFLPEEACRFYLTQEKLPKELMAPLADWWRESAYDLRKFTHRFFGSRIFYSSEYRANYIKSPIQYYLGLVQDLGLDVAPYPSHSVRSLAVMGQMPYRPPNVRGWVGGRTWVNSATLAARRQLIRTFFTPIREQSLNASDKRLLDEARAAGEGRCYVEPERLKGFDGEDPMELATKLSRYFLAGKASDEFIRIVADYLRDSESGTPAKKGKRKKNAQLSNTAVAISTILGTPEYQFC